MKIGCARWPDLDQCPETGRGIYRTAKDKDDNWAFLNVRGY